jgi:hypothetical protein
MQSLGAQCAKVGGGGHLIILWNKQDTRNQGQNKLTSTSLRQNDLPNSVQAAENMQEAKNK